MKEMDDLIRRDNAVQAVAEYIMYNATLEYETASDDIEDWKDLASDILAEIPPAAPAVRRGEWIVYYDKKEDGPLMRKCLCSECKEDGNTKWKYCSSCGSIMRGEKMDNTKFSLLARKIVYDYAWAHLDKSDRVGFPFEDVYIVWSCKTLQNNKAMISTNLPDGMYYEVTYNGDKEEFYLDAYKKFHNQKIVEDEIELDFTPL